MILASMLHGDVAGGDGPVAWVAPLRPNDPGIGLGLCLSAGDRFTPAGLPRRTVPPPVPFVRAEAANVAARGRRRHRSRSVQASGDAWEVDLTDDQLGEASTREVPITA